MFADSLLDAPAWANRSHRGWTTFISFAAQALALSGLLVLPVLYPQSLPQLFFKPSVLLTPPAPPPAPPLPSARASRPASNLAGDRLLMPAEIPHAISQIDDKGVPPAPNIPGDVGVAGGTGHTWSGGVVSSTWIAEVLPPPTPPATRPPIISRMMEGNLVHRVQPDYPQIARMAGIQGPVVLRAVISKAGAIENLQLVSGHPMLVKAAIDAVRQWRYRPYLLNGQPVEVDTQITVNFILQR